MIVLNNSFINSLVLSATLFVVVFACKEKSSENLIDYEVNVLGSVDEAIDEASGLVASRKYPGLLWTHNDSGDKPRLFLIEPEGGLIATVYLENVFNRDWEDIAAHYNKSEHKYYLYVGDIGDNRAVFNFKYIYRLEEPDLDITQQNQIISVADVNKILFQFSDGSRDAETLMIDPISEQLFLVTKREKNVGVYVFPEQITWGTDTLYLEKKLELPIYLAVAGDISVDGSEILIKDYESIYYWKREKSETVIDALSKPASMLPYQKEKQGESIAWDLSADGYYTLSEKSDATAMPTIYYYLAKRNQ
jgi:hypothetical protein